MDAKPDDGGELLAAVRSFGPIWRSVAVYSAVINLLYLVPAIYMLQIYDRVLSSRNEMTLWMLTALALGLYVLMAIVDWVRAQVIVQVGNQIDERLNPRVYRAAFDQSLAGSGAQAGQALNDLNTLRQFSTGNGLFALMDAPWFPVYLAVIYSFDWRLGVFSTVGAMALIVLAWANERRTHKPLAEANKAGVHASALMTSQFRNAEVIAAMGMLPALRQRWKILHELALKQQGAASEAAAGFGATSKSLRLALQSGILGVGALLVLAGDITPGLMIAASILMGRALAPVDLLINIWKSLASVRSAYERLNELLTRFPARKPGMALPPPKGHVQVEALITGLPNTKAPILKGVSLKLDPGQVLGVMGPSGSGKSTLARVLVGILPPWQGTARLDGADVHQWNKDELGPAIGYLPQDIELFAGTIAENIRRFGPDDPEGVVAAARLAGVHDLILRTPNGYDTLLAEGGGGLSGGQKQRIALARAVYRLPSLIVLDEPNSNLDDQGQQALSDALVKLKTIGKTVVVITHSQLILSATTHLALMKDGQVQAMGPSGQILEQLQRAQRGQEPVAAPGQRLQIANTARSAE